MFTYFKNDSLRNLVVAFGSLFNNIHIKRYQSDGTTVKDTIRVPLSYGNSEKYLRRIEEGGSIRDDQGREVAMTLPRISFEIESIDYDSPRKRNTMEKFQKKASSDSDNKMTYSYSEVPYNVNFNLYIMTKFMDDGLQIVEQILPYFTPEFTVSINPTSLVRKVDIPLILNSVTNEEEWEGDFEERRSLTWTLGFTAKSYIYGRTISSGVIKNIFATMFNKTSYDAGLTSGATSLIEIGVTGPSGASSDSSDYTAGITFHTFGSNTGDVDIWGDIIGE